MNCKFFLPNFLWLELTWHELIFSASSAKEFRGFTVNASLHCAGGVRLQAGGLASVVWTDRVLCHQTQQLNQIKASGDDKMSIQSNKYVLLTAVANIFFFLTASSFQRWFPKAFFPLFRFYVGQINSWYVIMKKKTRQNKKQQQQKNTSFSNLPQNTHRSPPNRMAWNKTLLFKARKAGRPASLPIATCITGSCREICKLANWVHFTVLQQYVLLFSR